MSRFNRIISLVPSLTELIIDLGLTEQMAGRTRFCVRPEEVVEDIPIIGGTKNPRVDKIVKKDPDCIIANKEENREEDIRELRERTSAQIEVTEVPTIDEALKTITHFGNLLDAKKKSKQLTTNIEKKLEQRPDKAPLRTAYFIWKEPWMTVGSDTYIHDVMEHWNLKNIFAGEKRYPTVELADLAAYHPEMIILSSEPYPFKEKHIGPVREACLEAEIVLMDGQWFSWYGSRMVESFEALNRWRESLLV